MSPYRNAQKPPAEGWAAIIERAGGALRTALGAAGRRASAHRLELLTALTLLGAGLLVLAEFLDLYEVRRGVVSIQEQTGGEHHSYALLVAGAGAIAATLAASSTGAWPPAAAAAALGLAALVVAFAGDLPDATSSGLTAEARLAEAQPAAGFWVEVAGGAITLVGGTLLAVVLRSRSASRRR